MESEIRTYIRELARDVDGPTKIRIAMKESKDVAVVIFHSPSFLVGINPQTHTTLRLQLTEHWVPGAYKQMTDSNSLRQLAPKYDKAMGNIRSSAYNPAIAAKASTRVQV